MAKRSNRLLGLLGLGGRRVFARLRHGNSRRLILSITGVALAIALMVVVSGVSVGLASQSTVYGANVDYWIVPETASASTMAVSVGGPQFGSVHATSEQINSFEGVEHASPVRMEVLRVHHANQSEYVLFVGVIAKSPLSVAGVNASSLSPGDPHYANGTYDGPWTGEAVLSAGAAELLNASVSERLTIANGSVSGQATQTSFTVHDVRTDSADTGAGSLPIAVVHLSELQSLTGGASGDTADQILVQTDNAGIKDRLAAIYPHSMVITGSGTSLQQLSSTDLALAVGITALLVALIVGTLFVGTAMGLEVTADREQFATLAAVGLPKRSRMLLVAVETITVTITGGLVGVALGYGGIWLTNRIAAALLPINGGTLAVFHPALAGYGLGVSLLIGLLAAPYLLWLTNQTSILEQLSGG